MIDTSVIIDLNRIDLALLPGEMVMAAITLGELATGPHAASDVHERAIRQDRLQRVEATFSTIPFDAEAARAYGQIYAAVGSRGQKARGRRALDLLIAAKALSVRLPLYTCNAADFEGVSDLIEVVDVSPVSS